MNTVTNRRNFLKSFIPKAIARTVGKSNEHAVVEQWQAIGHFTSYPPNTDSSQLIGDCQILIKSLYEGIQAMEINSKKFLGLKMKNDGQLFVNLGETWPENSALSILTGEQQQLIKG